MAKATYDVRDRCISNKISFKLIYWNWFQTRQTQALCIELNLILIFFIIIMLNEYSLLQTVYFDLRIVFLLLTVSCHVLPLSRGHTSVFSKQKEKQVVWLLPSNYQDQAYIVLIILRCRCFELISFHFKN